MSGESWNTFAHWMTPIILLGGPALLLWWAWRVARRRRHTGMPGGEDLPHAVPPPTRAARTAETLALAGLGLVIFALIATEPHTNGMLLRLDDLSPHVAERQKLAALLTGVLFAGLLLLAGFGRASAAAWLLAVLFIAYASLLNISDWAKAPRPGGVPAGLIQYTIHLRNTNAVGADLWVNDVYLGKTPVAMTLQEFYQKVPYWPEPPAEGEPLLITWYHSTSASTSVYPRWIRMQVPRLPEQESDSKFEIYYARVELNGEIGYAGGSAGSGRSGSNRQASSDFEVYFPARQRRLEALLDQARLADYQPSPAWFEAMATYDEDGWRAVRRAAEREPAMLGLLDAWASRRYGLDGVKDAVSAWRLLERIIEEAERERQYITAGVAGRAVELLAPRLDPAKLAEVAEPLIERTGSYRMMSFQMNGRTHFGMSDRRDRPSLGVSIMSSYVGWGSGEELSLTGLVLAHAVWRLDQHLDEEDNTGANVLEARLTPALLRQVYAARADLPLRLALQLGGPEVESFLLRMATRADLHSEEDWPGVYWANDRHLSGGAKVNRWLYHAAHLPGPGGDQFRLARREQVFAMTDRIIEEQHGRFEHVPDYLFMDLGRGGQGMAMEYWPRFLRVASRRGDSYDLPEAAWRYLLRMEPVSTPSMYLAVWRRFDDDDAAYRWKSGAIGELSELPPQKRQAIVEGLRNDLLRAAEESSPIPRTQQTRHRDFLLRQLEALPNTSETEAARLLDQLRSGQVPPEQRDNMGQWLTHEVPHHPLVARLAAAEDSSLRLMAVPPLAAHPTPAHQVLLRQLAEDTDTEVRAAAEQALGELAKLAATDPQALVVRATSPSSVFRRPAVPYTSHGAPTLLQRPDGPAMATD